MSRLIVILLLLTLVLPVSVFPSLAQQAPDETQAGTGENRVYFPNLQNNNPTLAKGPPAVFSDGYRVNVPYFEQGIRMPETAVFWFGQVTSSQNYADMRVGYTPTELYLHAGVVDRYLWYDPAGRQEDFHKWDSISVYLGNGEKLYRFDSQLSWWEQRPNFQVAYLYQNNAWRKVDIQFTTRSSWRGNAPNDATGDRGWMLTYNLPFASLGLAGAPDQGSTWKMGLALYDRDSQAGPPNAPTLWPAGFDSQNTQSWADLHFGMPVYTPPAAPRGELVVIRQGLNGVQTPDAEVGGTTTCGKGLDYWTAWGENKNPEGEFLNVQNQYDIADWPCFSRYYVTFPLDQVPAGKVILSARLVMHQFGSSGGGEWGDPPPSWIQVLRVEGGWREDALSWNTSPLAMENYTGTWVEGVANFPGWPGIRREWDVTQAVTQAYAAGQPVNLGLYSADGERHTGKYFVTSETPDWNAKARPRLEILWGSP